MFYLYLQSFRVKNKIFDGTIYFCNWLRGEHELSIFLAAGYFKTDNSDTFNSWTVVENFSTRFVDVVYE